MDAGMFPVLAFFKIKFCIYFFSINFFFFKSLEIYFLAQSTVEKKVILKTYLLKGVGMGKISVFQDKILYLFF